MEKQKKKTKKNEKIFIKKLKKIIIKYKFRKKQEREHACESCTKYIDFCLS